MIRREKLKSFEHNKGRLRTETTFSFPEGEIYSASSWPREDTLKYSISSSVVVCVFHFQYFNIVGK